jgi:tetratricopeptide (TPR) repeat protein
METKKIQNKNKNKKIKRNIVEYLKNFCNRHNKLVTGAIGFVLGIVLTSYLSPILAHIFPSIDKEPPTIIEVTPLPNSNLFNLSDIRVKIEDSGGSGLDLESSFIKLTGAYSGEINGTKISKDKVLIFIPSEKLKPDMYTAEFFIRDRAGNLKKDFSRFTLFEKPKLRFDFYEMPHLYSENDDVHGIKWKDRYIAYSFAIINEGDTVSLEDIEVTFDFPGVILNYIVMAKTSCVNCNIIEAQSTPSIVYGGKTETNFSTCQLIIDIEKLPPGGIFAGMIFIDPQYTPKSNEVITFCEFGSRYYGHYFYKQLGWTHQGSIEGEIKMSRDAWINKGIFLRNMGIKYNFPEYVKNSLNAFDNAIKIDKNSSVAWNEKGISLAYLGNFSGAIQAFNKSINISPNFEKPYYNIGLIYFKLKNCDIATNYANKALEINPNYEKANEIIKNCEKENIIAPRDIKNKIKDINENEGTIIFTTSDSNLFESVGDIIIFDFPVGSSRFILRRDANFNLFFEHISIQTGIRVAKINLSEFKKCDKLFIALTWSRKENKLSLGCLGDRKLVTEKAIQIDNKNLLIKNFLEVQQFLQVK